MKGKWEEAHWRGWASLHRCCRTSTCLFTYSRPVPTERAVRLELAFLNWGTLSDCGLLSPLTSLGERCEVLTMEPCQSIIKWFHVFKENNSLGMCSFSSSLNHSQAVRVYLHGKMQYCVEAVTETSVVPLGRQSTRLIVGAHLCTQKLRASCTLRIKSVCVTLRTVSKILTEGRERVRLNKQLT